MVGVLAGGYGGFYGALLLKPSRALPTIAGRAAQRLSRRRRAAAAAVRRALVDGIGGSAVGNPFGAWRRRMNRRQAVRDRLAEFGRRAAEAAGEEAERQARRQQLHERQRAFKKKVKARKEAVEQAHEADDARWAPRDNAQYREAKPGDGSAAGSGQKPGLRPAANDLRLSRNMAGFPEPEFVRVWMRTKHEEWLRKKREQRQRVGNYEGSELQDMRDRVGDSLANRAEAEDKVNRRLEDLKREEERRQQEEQEEKKRKAKEERRFRRTSAMKAKRQSQAQQKDAEHQAKLAALGKAKKDKEDAAAAEQEALVAKAIADEEKKKKAKQRR